VVAPQPFLRKVSTRGRDLVPRSRAPLDLG
jgi:hypothetical protein